MRSKLCPRCKTGKESYELDRLSPVCPYISVHDGKRCAMFAELEQEKGNVKKVLNHFSYSLKRGKKAKNHMK